MHICHINLLTEQSNQATKPPSLSPSSITAITLVGHFQQQNNKIILYENKNKPFILQLDCRALWLYEKFTVPPKVNEAQLTTHNTQHKNRTECINIFFFWFGNCFCSLCHGYVYVYVCTAHASCNWMEKKCKFWIGASYQNKSETT